MCNNTLKFKEIYSLSVSELAVLLKNREISSEEITEIFFDLIEQNDKRINAFISLTKENAIKTARKADSAILSGESVSPLTGIPCGIKDNICTKDIRTTCASDFLRNFIPPYDAFVIETLKNYATPILGKLNLDEFAMGSTTENSHFGPTNNPHDISKTPGGSSGGPAAAVASGEIPFSLGSDTGGSIRQPSAFCGTVGMKPTYGRISRRGLIAFASSMDQIGIITKNVFDNALILSEISLHDQYDQTSAKCIKENFTENISSDIKELKIGIPTELSSINIHPDINNTLSKAAEILEKQGAKLTQISIPNLTHAVYAYYIISCAEASSNLARYDGIRFGKQVTEVSDITELYEKSRKEGFGFEVKRRILTGTYILNANNKEKYYDTAVDYRLKLKETLSDIFKTTDLILTPTTPNIPLNHRTERSLISTRLDDVFTVPANMAGLPAISIPCGKTEEGMPLAVQLTGKKFDEKTLYRTAYALEKGISDLT